MEKCQNLHFLGKNCQDIQFLGKNLSKIALFWVKIAKICNFLGLKFPPTHILSQPPPYFYLAEYSTMIWEWVQIWYCPKFYCSFIEPFPYCNFVLRNQSLLHLEVNCKFSFRSCIQLSLLRVMATSSGARPRQAASGRVRRHASCTTCFRFLNVVIWVLKICRGFGSGESKIFPTQFAPFLKLFANKNNKYPCRSHQNLSLILRVISYPNFSDK